MAKNCGRALNDVCSALATPTSIQSDDIKTAASVASYHFSHFNFVALLFYLQVKQNHTGTQMGKHTRKIMINTIKDVEKSFFLPASINRTLYITVSKLLLKATYV